MATLLDPPAVLKARSEVIELVDTTIDPVGAVAMADARLDFGGSAWRLAVTLPNQKAEDAATLRALFNRLRVEDVVLRLPAPNQQVDVLGTETLASAILLTGAVAMANEVDLDGMTPGATVLAGSYVNLGEWLHEVVEDFEVGADGRALNVRFTTRLRSDFAAGSVVRLRGVTGVWRLVERVMPSHDEVGNMEPLEIKLREAIQL